MSCPRHPAGDGPAWCMDCYPEQYAKRMQPTPDTSIFNEAASEAAKEEAMARVELHAEPLWKDSAYRMAVHLARVRQTFTVDDLWSFIDKPREPRALGPLVLRLKKEGIWIETPERVKSKIPAHHQYPVTVYRSGIR
jgi:hypothetical protein